MHFDDRLATVLRHRAASERGRATQYRQLIDLLGAHGGGRDEDLRASAYLRLGALAEHVPDKARAAILNDPATRLRNTTLVARLAEDEPIVATAALTSASLQEDEWLELIPKLPIRARGLLRHRRDLPLSVGELLARLGVRDNVLPQPEGYQQIAAPAPRQPISASAPPAMPATSARRLENAGIGELVERIESYRKTRAASGSGGSASDSAPRLPLGESGAEAAASPINCFDFSADAAGRIDWADGHVASAMTGFVFSRESAIGMAMRRQQPVAGITQSLDDIPLLGGEWRVDAAPQFADPGGRYIGHVGRARRIVAAGATVTASCDLQAESPADRMRQMLHELRTPVNAIQGFAEVIQQQLFGPTPHEYRALAATIAGDAARMLAGFEELDRLARLETGALELDAGESDLAAMFTATTEQLGGMLRPRMSEFLLEDADRPCPVAMAKSDADAMVWRLLATLAGSVAAGEVIAIGFDRMNETVSVSCDLPARFLDRDDVFEASMRESASALSAGMFGAGFALRLARAEARAVGGDLTARDEQICLTLPLAGTQPLTGNGQGHSSGSG